MSDMSRQFLDLASIFPCLPAHKLFERLGKVSPARQKAIIKELEQLGYIKLKLTRLSRYYIRFIKILDKGWLFLNKQPSTHQGKGEIEHRCFVSYIIGFFAKKGYKAKRELLVPNTMHTLDAGIEQENGIIGFEVVTHTRSNLISHIKSCFVDSNAVKKLIIVAAQKSICDELRKIVESDLFTSQFNDRIDYQTIDTFMKELF